MVDREKELQALARLLAHKDVVDDIRTVADGILDRLLHEFDGSGDPIAMNNINGGRKALNRFLRNFNITSEMIGVELKRYRENTRG